MFVPYPPCEGCQWLSSGQLSDQQSSPWLCRLVNQTETILKAQETVAGVLSWLTDCHHILIYWDAPVLWEDNMRWTFSLVEVLLHITDFYFVQKQRFSVNVIFSQLVGLSFWRHPFTAEDILVSKWCTAATFPKIWWRNKLIYILDDLKVHTFLANVIFEWTVPLRVSMSSCSICAQTWRFPQIFFKNHNKIF